MSNVSRVPPRTFRLGGFVVSVGRDGASDRTARHSPAPSPASGPLLLADPPPVHTVTRRPAEGVDFIEDRIARRTDPVSGDLADQVAAHPWYHTLELPGGLVTEGFYDHRELVSAYGLPDDLSGRRALDVGSADGFWSFELERRGARVTAVDIASTDDVDLPEPVRALARARGLTDPLRDGFELAKRALGSEVELVTQSVYDLDPERLGTFDLVHLGDILLHLREPLRALERVRAVTGGEALISDVFDPGLEGNGVTRYAGGWRTAGWWVPSLDTLAQLVLDAGFARCEVLTTYRLSPRGEVDGPWRAVLRAHAS